MLVTSVKMPSNQDFCMSIFGSYQMARFKASREYGMRILIMFCDDYQIKDGMDYVKLRNGCYATAINSKEDLLKQNINSFDFFIYGPNAVAEYFETVNSIRNKNEDFN